MRLFNKQIITLAALLAIGTTLIGCSAGGNCNTNVNPNPTITPSPTPTVTPSPDPSPNPDPSPEPGTLSLAIAAPNQYPAGLPNPIVVPITMTNTSDVDAKDLIYTIPDSSNYTKVVITPNPTGVASNDCTNIPAGTSCDMTVTIAAYAHPGSFTVLATPTVSMITKISNVIFNKASNSIQVTANLGLVDIPDTQNKFYILPTKQIIEKSTQTTKAYVSVLVKANIAFDTLILVDGETGEPLTAQLLGNLSTAQNTVNTYLVDIPANLDVQNIQVFSKSASTITCNTLNVGTNDISACSNNAQVLVNESNIGILDLQPTYVVMSPTYESQIVTLVNTGKANINNLTLPTARGFFDVVDSTCTTTLTPNQACNFRVNYASGYEDGLESFVVTYNNGTADAQASMIVSYIGRKIGILNVSPTNIELSATHPSQEITITNTGRGKLIHMNYGSLTAPVYYPTPNICGESLAPNESCTYTVSYPGTVMEGSMIQQIKYNNSEESLIANVGISYKVATVYAYVLMLEMADYTKRGVYKCGMSESGSIYLGTTNGVEYCQRQSNFNQINSLKAIHIDMLGNQKYAYITAKGAITQCKVDVAGDFFDCNDDAGVALFDVAPSGDAELVDTVIAKTGDTYYAYILADANSSSNYGVYTCTLTDDYLLDECTRLPLTTEHPTGITVDDIYNASTIYINGAQTVDSTEYEGTFKYNLDVMNGQPTASSFVMLATDTNSEFYHGGLAYNTYGGTSFLYSGYRGFDGSFNSYRVRSCELTSTGDIDPTKCNLTPYTPSPAVATTLRLNLMLDGKWYEYFAPDGGAGRPLFKCDVNAITHQAENCDRTIIQTNSDNMARDVAFTIIEETP